LTNIKKFNKHKITHHLPSFGGGWGGNHKKHDQLIQYAHRKFVHSQSGIKVETKPFLSEQPFTLNDEIVPLMKNFSLNPLEKKRKLFSVCS
jgi:hypothetical protein